MAWSPGPFCTHCGSSDTRAARSWSSDRRMGSVGLKGAKDESSASQSMLVQAAQAAGNPLVLKAEGRILAAAQRVDADEAFLK